MASEVVHASGADWGRCFDVVESPSKREAILDEEAGRGKFSRRFLTAMS